jgi:uncharacterized protein (TIRG00374 family)
MLSAEDISTNDIKRRSLFLFSWRWLRWVVAIVLLLLCARFIDLSLTIKILSRVSIYWIIFILALWTIDRCLMAWKWSFLLRALGVQIQFSTLIGFYYQGTFAGTFLPSSLGGDLLRGYWVSRTTGATHQVYAALIMEKLLGFLSAANWALIGSLVFVISAAPRIEFYWIITAISGTLLLNALFFVSLQPSCSAWIQQYLNRLRGKWVFGFFQRVCEAYWIYNKRRSILMWSGLLTLIEHALQMVIVLLMARGLGISTQSIIFLAIVAVYLFVYRLPLSPDGWGVGEITAMALFGLIGVSPESGFSLAFLSHVLQTIVVLPGLWFLWRSGCVPMNERTAVVRSGLSDRAPI